MFVMLTLYVPEPRVNPSVAVRPAKRLSGNNAAAAASASVSYR